MEIRFCRNYSFGGKIFTNYQFDDNGEVTYCSLRAKEVLLNGILQFKDVSLQNILVDLGIPLEYLEFSKDFDDTIFKKGSTIDFGLGDFSYPNVRDFIEGKTSELILDIKEV